MSFAFRLVRTPNSLVLDYLTPLEEQRREVPFGAPRYCEAPYTVSMVGAGYKVRARLCSRYSLSLRFCLTR